MRMCDGSFVLGNTKLWNVMWTDFINYTTWRELKAVETVFKCFAGYLTARVFKVHTDNQHVTHIITKISRTVGYHALAFHISNIWVRNVHDSWMKKTISTGGV